MNLLDHEELEAGRESAGAAGWLRKAKVLAILAVLALLAVMMGMFIHSAAENQAELREQLAYQSEVIDGLRKEIEDAKAEEEYMPVITHETVAEQLSALQELVTQEYVYTNADKKESSVEWFNGWKRPFSGKSLLITYDGSIKAGIDLNKIQIEVHEDIRTITVQLPPARITDNQIPQESIEVVEVKNGLFNQVTFDNYNDFIVEQKAFMEQKAIDMGLLTRADEEAQTAVKSLMSALPGMDTYKLNVVTGE